MLLLQFLPFLPDCLAKLEADKTANKHQGKNRRQSAPVMPCRVIPKARSGKKKENTDSKKAIAQSAPGAGPQKIIDGNRQGDGSDQTHQKDYKRQHSKKGRRAASPPPRSLLMRTGWHKAG